MRECSRRLRRLSERDQQPQQNADEQMRVVDVQVVHQIVYGQIGPCAQQADGQRSMDALRSTSGLDRLPEDHDP